MKVVIDRVAGGPVGFSAFAKTHGLTMYVRERGVDFAGTGRDFYAHFQRVEVKDGCMLASVAGDGATPALAIADYRKRLRGRLLVVDAMQESRREIQCPNEWAEEPGATERTP